MQLVDFGKRRPWHYRGSGREERGGRRAPVGGHGSSRGGSTRQGHIEQRLIARWLAWPRGSGGFRLWRECTRDGGRQDGCHGAHSWVHDGSWGRDSGGGASSACLSMADVTMSSSNMRGRVRGSGDGWGGAWVSMLEEDRAPRHAVARPGASSRMVAMSGSCVTDRAILRTLGV
jgi:hypothetical protein